MKIGFIGLGNMASAMIGGILKKNLFKSSAVLLSGVVLLGVGSLAPTQKVDAAARSYITVVKKSKRFPLGFSSLNLLFDTERRNALYLHLILYSAHFFSMYRSC